MWLRTLIAGLAALLASLGVAALVARAAALELTPANTPQGATALGLGAALLAIGALVVARRWHAWLTALGNRGLAVIALVCCLHFAVSYASRITGGAIATLLGPLAIFLQGITGEGLPALLLAVTVVLLPQPGTLLLSIACVFLLNSIFSGTLGLMELVFVSISAAAHEGAAWMLGLTRGPLLAVPSERLSLAAIAAVALAIGLANATGLGAQYLFYQALFRLYFAPWYIVAVVVITGLGYGALGGAAGAILGARLRRTAA